MTRFGFRLRRGLIGGDYPPADHMSFFTTTTNIFPPCCGDPKTPCRAGAKNVQKSSVTPPERRWHFRQVERSTAPFEETGSLASAITRTKGTCQAGLFILQAELA